MKLATVMLDSADPGKLAEFYRVATRWEVTYSDDDFVMLGDGGPIQLGFQRVEGYEGPGWPDDRKHVHLDFTVQDVAKAVENLLGIGATKPDFQPGDGNWTVLADPEGHLFCISAES
ncbi:VOC family protein [Saccharothrix sp.]|uniref:VOC family protein n=1 Tax=Saccharothrix sp. TaxID=1873460 RepID=UPI002812725E|nr:VOC family protein [Saccharothrix sp.]